MKQQQQIIKTIWKTSNHFYFSVHITGNSKNVALDLLQSTGRVERFTSIHNPIGFDGLNYNVNGWKKK